MKTVVFLVIVNAYAAPAPPVVTEMPTMHACESAAKFVMATNYRFKATCQETPDDR